MIGVTTTIVTEIVSTSAKGGGEVTGDTGEYIPLVDHLMKNRFKLFNRSRQKIISSVQEQGIIKPFQMYTDSMQEGKQFVVGGFSYNLTKDSYEVELFEYDNSIEINLV